MSPGIGAGQNASRWEGRRKEEVDIKTLSLSLSQTAEREKGERVEWGPFQELEHGGERTNEKAGRKYGPGEMENFNFLSPAAAEGKLATQDSYRLSLSLVESDVITLRRPLLRRCVARRGGRGASTKLR